MSSNTSAKLRNYLRPCPTSRRHMYGVHDNKAAVKLGLCRNADALSGIRDGPRRFYSHDGIAVAIDVQQATSLLHHDISDGGDGKVKLRAHCSVLVDKLYDPC